MILRIGIRFRIDVSNRPGRWNRSISKRENHLSHAHPTHPTYATPNRRRTLRLFFVFLFFFGFNRRSEKGKRRRKRKRRSREKDGKKRNKSKPIAKSTGTIQWERRWLVIDIWCCRRDYEASIADCCCGWSSVCVRPSFVVELFR